MCAKVNAWNSDGTRSHARERTNAPVRHNNIVMIYNNISESRGPETVDHRRQFNIILLRNANDDDDTNSNNNNYNILILI